MPQAGITPLDVAGLDFVLSFEQHTPFLSENLFLFAAEFRDDTNSLSGHKDVCKRVQSWAADTLCSQV